MSIKEEKDERTFTPTAEFIMCITPPGVTLQSQPLSFEREQYIRMEQGLLDKEEIRELEARLKTSRIRVSPPPVYQRMLWGFDMRFSI